MLYIAGRSGSGKSTTALSLARPDDKVIHLDWYSEPFRSRTLKGQNKDFNRYLDKKVPNWRRMTNATKDGKNGTLKRFSNEYWDIVDSFRNAVESYGKDQFKKGHRVIVEGVQLTNGWFDAGFDYYIEKPTIILNTGLATSSRRALDRDYHGDFFWRIKKFW